MITQTPYDGAHSVRPTLFFTFHYDNTNSCMTILHCWENCPFLHFTMITQTLLGRCFSLVPITIFTFHYDNTNSEQAAQSSC